MKKVFLFILIFCQILNSASLPAQNIFKKDYATALGGSYGLNELSSGSYITGLRRSLNRLDANGNLVFVSGVYTGGLVSLNFFLKTDGGRIYFDGVFQDSCGPYLRYRPLVGLLDTNGNVLNAHYYTLNGRCYNFTQYSCINYDNGVTSVGTGGVISSPGIYQPGFALRTDSAGNLLWGKVFSNHTGGGQFVKQTPDSGFIIGFNFDTCGATLAKLDAMGNVQWCKSYIRPRALLSDGWANADGTFMLCGLDDSLVIQGNNYPAWLKPKLFFMKVDANGSVLWAKGYDGTDPYHFSHDSKFGVPLIKKVDSNFVIIASKLSPVTQSVTMIMLKLDGNGDTLWTNAICSPGYGEYHISLYNTSDKGFLIGGYKYGAVNDYYFLYKTDSMFNTLCANHHEPIDIIPLFPIDSNVVLNSIDGGVSQFVIFGDTNGLPTSIYDDCVLIDKLNQHNGERKINVYPNPTTGKLMLEFAGPLTSDCYFTVYDYTGRVVFQRTLYTEKEKIEVDLSPYGKGLYLVEFTEKEQVSVKKVVVE